MAPSACSAPDRNGSTTLIALTRPALSAAAMSGNGMTTYFTEAGLTPSALSMALAVSVWMLLVRLTAIVLPASLAGEVMPELGMASTPKLAALHCVPATRIFRLNVPLAWPSI